MKIFRIISATLLFLQGSVIANGDELAREIASEANEVLAAAHGSRPASPVHFSPIDDSAFSPILSIDVNTLSVDTAKQNLKAALERVNIFNELALDVFRAANVHPEIKLALQEYLVAYSAQGLNHALTPAEKLFLTEKLDLLLELVKAKVNRSNGLVVTSVNQLTNEKLGEAINQHASVANAYQRFFDANAQIVAERCKVIEW